MTALKDKIRGLQRLLAYPGSKMPADVRQDKERELAGYLADQQKEQAEKDKNKNLTRYHFVRFMERKKAERALKKLISEESILLQSLKLPSSLKNQTHRTEADDLSADDEEEGGVSLPPTEDRPRNDETDSHAISPSLSSTLQLESLQQRIYTARVDLNYCLYSPLDQKYISLFPTVVQPLTKSGRVKNRPDPAAEMGRDLKSGIFRSAGGEKPPLWHEVKESMEQGGTEALERLRDGKAAAVDHLGQPLKGKFELLEVGGRGAADARRKSALGVKRRHDWLDEDERIPEEDLDSESEGFFE